MKSHLRLLTTLAMSACILMAGATSASAAPPVNDNFADAATISGLAPYVGTNAESTVESATSPTEVQQLQTIAGWGFFNTVWHRFEASEAGDVSFVVCSSFQTNFVATVNASITTLAAPNPTIGPVAAQGTSAVGLGDPDGCTQGEYKAVVGPFPVSAGSVIRPMVGSAFSGQTGAYKISTRFTAAPANDAFANRTVLYSRHAVNGTNVAASTETNEANNPYTNYRSVWYDFYATDNSTVDIEVCSEFPANVVAYSGESLPLTPVAYAQGSTPDTCNGTSYRTFLDDAPVSSSQHLKIQVGGYSSHSHTGAFSIVVRYNGAPVNETWNAATDLGNGASAIVYGDNTNSTTDPEAPSIGGQYRTSSVWYKWTAPVGGPAVFDTCSGPASGTNLMLTVFATNDPVPAANNLGEVGTDYDGCDAPRGLFGKVSISVAAGKEYWIAVSAESTSAAVYSDFTLKISTAPTNTAPPAISGVNRFVGTQLSVSDGTWIGSAPITYGYQWMRCDENGDGCIDIAGAQSDTYTPTGDDVDSTLKARVDAYNSAGSGSIYSPPTSLIDSDPDGDGVGTRDDNCLAAQTGPIKPNGCAYEEINVTDGPSISGDRAEGSITGLTLAPGAADNSPGDDDSVDAPVATLAWFRCTSSSDTGTCAARSASGQPDHYVVEEDDLGGWIRGRVTWANSDSDVDEWTDALPVYFLSIFNRPSITGTPQVGQTLTGVDGLGVNVPATVSGDVDPAVAARSWLYCTSPTDENSCTPSGQTGSTLTPPAGAAGKYVVFGVTWENGITTRYSDTDIIGPIASAPVTIDPPAPYSPLDLSKLVLPKKASFKGIAKAKGKFTIKTVQLACPAGGAACVITLDLTAKVKGKTKKLGSSTMTIPAGSTQPLTGKLSGSGLKLFKKNKKLKATIAMKGKGGSAGKATFKEFTITK